MLNKINEINKLLKYANTPQNITVINNILDHTLQRCETLYYKTVLYPQLEDIWKNENTLPSSSTSTPQSSPPPSPTPTQSQQTPTPSQSQQTPTPSQSQQTSHTLLYYKEEDILNIKSSIAVLIFICMATQPISGFSGNQ